MKNIIRSKQWYHEPYQSIQWDEILKKVNMLIAPSSCNID